MKLITLILMTIFVAHATEDMKIRFAAVCYEAGGVIDDEGYCDLENAKVGILRDINVTDWKW